MEIIPVIDLRNKKAVKAYKGEREKYKDLIDGIELAKFYKDKFNRVYIADLDSIINGFFVKSNFETILEISNFLNVIVDFGIRNFDEYKKINEKVKRKQNKEIKLIVGTETYKSENFPNDCIISIDTINGNFDENLLEKLKNFKNEIIVLDLKRIGTKNLNFELCKKVYEKIGRKFIYGGGVTSENMKMIEKFCYGVLMGTEIYEKLNLC